MTHNPLKFKSMSMEVGQYGANKGKITCRVRSERFDTVLETVLPDDITVSMMELIAPVISASVHKSLLDVQRDHEAFVLGQAVDEKAKAIEDGTGEDQTT